MNFIQAMEIAERGLKAWAEQPHNEKWRRRIEGTPIPNDLLVCIATEMVKASKPKSEA